MNRPPTQFSLLGLHILLFVNSQIVQAQQPPSDLKWYSIKTPQFRIVFHEGLEDQAIHTASLMDYVSDKVPGHYNFRPKPISLYLNSLTTTANAYVALAPRHMHFYAHPPQDVGLLGNADWFSLLAIHEYRHVMQFDFLNRNLLQIPSVLAGDLGRGFAAFLLVPLWYYEGDAISAETTLTSFGRGRMPEFEMPLKAILTGTEQKFTYNQAYLQSYKRYFPNHYYLGYFMHTHVSNNYGYEAWPMTINRVTKGFGFSGSLKKATGFNSRKTYKNTMQELKDTWTPQVQPIHSGLNPVINENLRLYTSFRHGYRMNDESIVSVKYGLDRATEIVRSNADGKTIRVRGLNNDGRISSNGSKLVWSSSTPHPRWGMQDFSDIMIMDIETEEVKKLTSGVKYVSPAISPAGDLIAAVKYGQNMMYSIDILDAHSGNLISEIATQNEIPRTPSWSVDGNKVVYTTNSINETTISVTGIYNQSTFQINFDKEENISTPLLYEHYILFGSTADGNNDIHAIDTTTGNRFRVLSGGFGYFNPTHLPGSKEIIVESYTPKGYRLYSWLPVSNDFSSFEKNKMADIYITPLLNDTLHFNILEEFVPDVSDYTVEKYSHFANGMKLHSWYFLPANQGISGTAVMSDPLSVHNISATIEYNQNETTTNPSVSYTWAGLYPVFGLTVLNGKRTMYSSLDSINYQWNEQTLNASISLPLNLSREDFVHSLNVSTGYDYTFINGLNWMYKEDYEQGNGKFMAGGLSLDWMGYKAMALRDIYPRLGFKVGVHYNSTLQNSNYTGSLMSLSATAYLPGIVRNHSLRLQASYEKQDPDFNPDKGYIYPSRVLYFRGYDNIFHLQNTILSADYALPLLYPDLGLGPIVYCKRIRGNLFMDYGYSETLNYKEFKGSYGADLLFDLNFFRFPAELDLGVRHSRTFDGDVRTEFIFYQRF